MVNLYCQHTNAGITKGFTMLSKIRTALSHKSIIIILLLVLLAAVAGGIYLKRNPQSAETVSTESELKTALAREGDLVIYASGSGTLISTSESSFGFNTNGQVAKLDVQVGDVVEAGQVLAELNNTSATLALKNAQRTLNELTSPAAIATAKDAVATAEYNVSTTREDLQYLVSPAVQIWQERLEQVEKALADAEAAVKTDPSDENKQKLQPAKDAVTLAQAYLADAQDNYYTYLVNNFSEMRMDPRSGNSQIIWYRDATTGKKYSKIHAPTETEIGIAQAAYDLAKATLEEAETYLAAISGGEPPEGARSTALTTLENARTAVQIAQLDLEGTQLVAPISGTVMSIDCKVGDTVSENSSVITIADLSQPSLEIFLETSDWGNIEPGYETEVTFDILPDSTFTGKVIRVDPGLYTENYTSVVRAIVSLQDAQAVLKLPLGSTAAVDVIGGRAENAVLIPVEALHKAGEQYAVFVMKNGELKLRIVGVGIQNTQYAEITSGLEAGEVVTTGITETK
jgi:HlyD family secretion protein